MVSGGFKREEKLKILMSTEVSSCEHFDVLIFWQDLTVNPQDVNCYSYFVKTSIVHAYFLHSHISRGLD